MLERNNRTRSAHARIQAAKSRLECRAERAGTGNKAGRLRPCPAVLSEPFGFKQFEEEDVGFLRFHDCLRYRLGPTNDEGWYRGQCRYSRSAPAWGEFYEITGYDFQLNRPTDWVTTNGSPHPARHFLFYLRDETFECIASGWSFDSDPSNALCRVLGPKPRD
jgi:hypothetical protein